MRQVPFSIDLWHDIKLQPEQNRDTFKMSIAENGPTWTFCDGEGHCIATGGLYEALPGIAVAWAFIGADARPHMLELALQARAVLRAHLTKWPVIRAGVVRGFAAGERLMRLLGFKPLGTSVELGARVYSVFQLTGREH